MTIFHVIQYSGHARDATEYPAWVIKQFDKWYADYLELSTYETTSHKLNDLLLEYDPEIHGEELYNTPL